MLKFSTKYVADRLELFWNVTSETYSHINSIQETSKVKVPVPTTFTKGALDATYLHIDRIFNCETTYNIHVAHYFSGNIQIQVPKFLLDLKKDTDVAKELKKAYYEKYLTDLNKLRDSTMEECMAIVHDIERNIEAVNTILETTNNVSNDIVVEEYPEQMSLF